MAAPLARDQETLVDELLESQHDGAARNAEIFGQDSAGRQRHRGRDLPVENGGDDRLADLRLQGLARLREMRKSPGQIAASFLCGMGFPSRTSLAAVLDQRFVPSSNQLRNKISDRYDLCQ